MFDTVSLFAFKNGDDTIVVGSINSDEALEIAFAQCNDNKMPLCFIGEIEWNDEMQNMMPHTQLGLTVH